MCGVKIIGRHRKRSGNRQPVRNASLTGGGYVIQLDHREIAVIPVPSVAWRNTRKLWTPVSKPVAKVIGHLKRSVCDCAEVTKRTLPVRKELHFYNIAIHVVASALIVELSVA